jgi:hypothetical protein
MGGAGSPRYLWRAWLLIGAAWVWVGLALVYFTDAACPILAFCVLAPAGLLVGTMWTMQTVASPQTLRRPLCFPWLSVPLIGLFGCLLLFTNWGLAVRVAASEPGLTAEARAALAGNKTSAPGDQVGLFRVEELRVAGGGVYFYTGWDYMDRVGVAFLPPGSAPAPRIRIQPLYGPWYRFTWKF